MQSKVDDVLKRVRDWSRSDQWELLEGLVAMMRQESDVQSRYNVLDFEGIGRETWEGVDVDEYLRQERTSWDD